MDLKLVPVTESNWRTAAFLTTDPERKIPLDEQWLTSNAFSLLQCRYDPDWDCRLMYDGDKAVGFVFYGYWREEDRYLLCRYMIDIAAQGRGYGKAFLPLVIDLIRKQYDCQDLYTSIHDDNDRSIALFQHIGFVSTEEMDAEERVYILRGDA